MPVLRVAYPNDDPELGASILLRRFGPQLEMTVRFPVLPDQGPDRLPPERTVWGLIDTGASQSCIDVCLAEALGLPVIDRTTVNGIAGTGEHDVYLAEVLIPALEILRLGPFVGVGPDDSTAVILGRDMLEHLVMIYDGSAGSITICR